MRDRIRRLQPATRVAADQEADAGRALADVQRRLTEHGARLAQLESFRQEYADQFARIGREGMSARRAQDYTAFIDNLDQSIRSQRNQISRLQEELETRRKAWLQRRARSKALEGVVERYVQELRRDEDRREQGEQDEHGLRGKRDED